MVAAVYTVQYVIRRKNFSGQTFSHKREISMDSEIYKKNYNTAELTNFFKQSVAVYHNDLERFESFRFYKTCDKNNTEDSENYSNILNFFDKKKVNREIESSQKVSKPKKSVWRRPNWMIPFRIIWYLIKKVFSIMWWMLEGKKD